jgi:hypothetical protein
MAKHTSTRTIQLYDRRRDEMSVDEVERMVFAKALRTRLYQGRNYPDQPL